jgi:HME family heavy-metal exporter
MLDTVIRFSLKHRPLIVFGCLVVLLYGGYMATTLSLDVLPDLDRPRVVVLTETPGLAPEAVEVQVTQPIETILLGLPGVQAIRSESSPGLSVIRAEFDWSTSTREARQSVQERISTVVLPEGMRPFMAPSASILGQIMHVGFYRQRGPGGGTLAPLGQKGLVAELVDENVKVWKVTDRHRPAEWEAVHVEAVEDRNTKRQPTDAPRQFRLRIKRHWHDVTFQTTQQQQMDLRTTAVRLFRPRLMQVPGVTEVFILGGDQKQYQVIVNPPALEEFGITLQDVVQAVRDSNVMTSGGFTEQQESDRAIRILGLLGPLPADVLTQLPNVPIKANAERSILLGQVASFREAPPQKRGDASIDGHPGILITLTKQPHADTRQVTEKATAAVEAIEASLPPDLVVTTDLFQLKRFIDRGLYHVGEALVIGAVLVLLILTLFLLNVRTTFISLTAIPLSLAITTLVFRLIGKLTGTDLSINVMTLGGLAVAMGELVDDAIVDVENIFRRLRENRKLGDKALSPLRVVFEASREVRGAIVFGTMVVILVFIPLFALSGLEGRLFVPLGIAYIVSILASLVVSLTVTPVMSYYLLPQAPAVHRERDSWLLRGLKAAARPVIRFSMNFAAPLLLLVWCVVGLAAWQMTRLGADFLPPFDEGSMQIDVALPPGASLQASNRACAIVDAKLRTMQRTAANPNAPLLHFYRRTGRAELDEHVEPVNATEYLLTVNPASGLDRETLRKRLETELKAELAGADVEVEQPLAHLISHVLSGVNAPLAIKIQGDDLNQLRKLAEKARDAAQSVRGVTAVVEGQQLIEEVHIKFRPGDLAFHKMSAAQAATFVETALNGNVVSQVREGVRTYDLVVRLDEDHRRDVSRLNSLRMALPDGAVVTLGDLADVVEELGPNLVKREDARRQIAVRCQVHGRDLGSAVAEVEQAVRGRVALPEGYLVEFTGQLESQQRATLVIAGLSVIALCGIFVVLLILYPSVRIVLQVLNAVPVAFIGGVAALTLTGQSLTVASLVGFVSLAGISVRNGILLMSHYVHLMRREGETFSQRMIERGSLERLAPVLMTALTAGIALVPLVLGGHRPGLEILYPVATVILGGLITSTLCEFLIHPGLFWRFSGREGERLALSTGGDIDIIPSRERVENHTEE